MRERTKPSVLTGLMAAIILALTFNLIESGSAAGKRFEKLENGTVRDNKTGLIWAAQDNGTNVNWSFAKNYCETFSAGGHNDWRMPEPEELATLYGGKKKEKGKDYSMSIDLVTEEIKLTAPWIWTARRSPNNKSIAYGFNYGTTRKLHRGNGLNRRALPVRSSSTKQ